MKSNSALFGFRERLAYSDTWLVVRMFYYFIYAYGYALEAGMKDGKKSMNTQAIKQQYASLSYRVSLQSVIVIGIAMSVYSVIYYLQDPQQSLIDLFAVHLSQVFILGLLIHLSLTMVLQKSLVKPLEQLYVKLYAVTKGDFQPVVLDTDIKEIQEIAGGINAMLNKLAKHPTEITLKELKLDVRRLEGLAKDENLDLPPATRDYLYDLADRIQAKLHQSS